MLSDNRFHSRFKNVMFEIKSGDEIGVFEVSAKFMGVAMEKVELVFQVRLLNNNTGKSWNLNSTRTEASS